MRSQALPHRCRVAAARLPVDAAFPARAAAALEPCEAAQASRLRHPERRRQWLAARLLAKRLADRPGIAGEVEPGTALAVVDLAANDPAGAGAAMSLRRWTVVPAEGGAPALLEDGAPSATSLSLAHAGDLVVAAISRSRVGADVERVAPELHAWTLRAYPRAEAAWIASVPIEGPLLATVLWSVKECLLKTGACGSVAVARIAPLEVRPLLAARDACRLLDRGAGWLPFPIDPPAARGAGVQAFVQRVDGMVLAVVALSTDEDREEQP